MSVKRSKMGRHKLLHLKQKNNFVEKKNEREFAFGFQATVSVIALGLTLPLLEF